jgi:hypothetical protein
VELRKINIDSIYGRKYWNKKTASTLIQVLIPGFFFKNQEYVGQNNSII